MSNLAERLKNGLRERYVVDRELGQGGMAVVFLAHDLRHDRQVALKALRPEISAEIGAERFLREIKIAAGLNHPHILPVYDSGQVDGLLFYVMPPMEGRSLRDRLDAERQLPLDDALRITREVASALDYAHRHQVVHRDVKPENILLHEGAALVADFGIGKALGGEGSITQTGMMVGTPAYMSPEQASGEQAIDGRSDLYSLGCVLYEMLAGEPPFTGPNAQAILAKRFVSPTPSIRATRDIPEAVDTAVTRALSRTPVDRYPTAAEFAEALRNISLETVAGLQRTPPEMQKRPPTRKSIAVLPLTNRSADPENEYFSDGMTEEIINVLGKVPGIQVASCTSSFAFKGRDIDVRQVGQKLGVGTVLEGGVRKVGNRIRITAQLTDVQNGYTLWTETYDRQLEDVFAIQDEISRAIVDALKLKLIGKEQPLVVPTTTNLEAYTLYLRGRFHCNKYTDPDLRRAIASFEQALAKEPGYARAHAGIADSWSRLADDWVPPAEAYPKAKAAALRALELDPTLPEALTSLGRVHCWYEWDFAIAERDLRRSVQLNPSSADTHFVLGTTLPALGQLHEAIESMRQALVFDPLSPIYGRYLGRLLLYARDYDAAIQQGQATLELHPGYSQAFVNIGSAYLGKGQPQEAFSWYQQGQSLDSAVRSYDALLVRALAALGEQEEAEAILARLMTQAATQYIRAESLAMAHAAVGDLDQAFACLEQAFAARSAGLIFLHVDPAFEPLRSDSRFAALVQRIGLK
ncbi:MAG: protein kinase domain-containing protein [Gemmatimonadales bacterium]